MTIPQLPLELNSIFAPLAEGHGISQDSLRRLAELLDFPIGGKPGRPTKDYSQEYELKLSGRSWTDVTRDAVSRREELREEFGGIAYDSLGPLQQQQVVNRIRQGVRGYAKRVGKPLPSEADVSEPTPAQQEQKTP